MIVRTQTVRFTPDRAPTPRKVKIGFEGDNMVERLCFKLPRIAENQTATMMLDGEYANMVILTEDEDRYYVDLTAELIGGDGEHEAYIVIDGGDTGEAWGSGTFVLQVGEIPGFAGDIAERFPDAIERLRSEIAGHRAEMQETSEEIKAEADAAQKAVLAAENQAGQAGAHSKTAEAAASDAQEAKAAAQKSAEYTETLYGAVENATENAFAARDVANNAALSASQMGAMAEIAAMRAEKAAQKTEDALSGGDDGQVLGSVGGEPTWIDLPESGGGDVTTDALDAAFARHNASGGAHPDIRAMIDAMGGGTGGAVASVNGKTGAVVLTAEDVGAVATHQLEEAVDDALAQAKESGEFDGAPGADGSSGVHVGSDEPQGDQNVWIDPKGEANGWLDESLTQAGRAADAKATGDKISKLSEEIAGIELQSNGSKFTAEGKSVVGYSVAGNDLELSARMVAYQSGTGLPSPENVRPIAGFDVLTFNRTEDGAEVTVNLGETVYGGTVDLTTGVLTIDRGVIVVDGNSNVTRQAPNDGEETICIAWNTGLSTDYTKRLDDICDKLPHAVTVHVSNWESANAQGTKYAECFSFGPNASTCMWLYIRLNKSRFAGSYEVADVKAWLAENPLTITYALTEPRTVQLTPQTMAALTGMNTLSTNATSMTVRGVDHPIGKTQTMQDYEPKKQIVGLPVLKMSGDNSEETKDNKVTLSYAWLERLGTLKSNWQGSSSINFGKNVGGKMNHKIKFDEAFEVVEGWGVHDTYVLKADVVDALHVLNVFGAKIHGQMVKSRTNDPDNLSILPNGGAIDGFPVIVELNGEFHGLYTWTIPKDGWMMGMGSGENEAILCADMHVAATQFKAEALCDGSDFKLEYVSDENNAGWVKTSLNAMINACINSDGSDIDTTVATHLNIPSMIDHMCFTVVFDAHDNTDKNYLISTKNGVRWFITEYDLDSILGMWFDGSYFRPATDWLRTFSWWSNHNRAAHLIYTHKRAELKARYLELRRTVLSDDNIITIVTNYVNQIPENVYRADREKWPLLPNTSGNTVARIADWYCRRAAYIDKEVNGWA